MGKRELAIEDLRALIYKARCGRSGLELMTQYHRFLAWFILDPRVFIAAVASAALVLSSSAAIVGTNVPAQSVTPQRIAQLPRRDQFAWKDYLKRSVRQRQADQSVLEHEMRAHGITAVTLPPEGRGGLPLNEDDAWYSTTEAHRIAAIVVSFQTPAGGWGKNLNMTIRPRAPGTLWGPNNDSRFLRDGDFDASPTNNWNYIGTFDNDATITQLRFLSRVVAAGGTNDAAPARESFLRGLDYIFESQYPNGGWPQVWPLQGGYHDTITFNDDAMSNILGLLRDVAERTNHCRFVPAKDRRRAAAAMKHGFDLVLKTQIVVTGRPTAWAQQFDALTLEPASARNYEMPAIAAAESARVMTLLMSLPNPDARTVAAVHSAAAWFTRSEIRDVAFRRGSAGGRRLVPAPGAGPIWSRYYDIDSNRPIFGDRDKSIHDDVNEISLERRNGYAWFGPTATPALAEYTKWSEQHPLPAP